ncbi:MAG TPA: hypothetical protein VJT72_20195, partial [Pseudonocardiaceae bacterium]|nr:hypothetical protein [Pseudonocardiaceae bacterium]
MAGPSVGVLGTARGAEGTDPVEFSLRGLLTLPSSGTGMAATGARVPVVGGVGLRWELMDTAPSARIRA